jgi:hypothetical protein
VCVCVCVCVRPALIQRVTAHSGVVLSKDLVCQADFFQHPVKSISLQINAVEDQYELQW